MERLTLCRGTFTYDQKLDNSLEGEDGIWLSEQSIEIVLKVDKAVADYLMPDLSAQATSPVAIRPAATTPATDTSAMRAEAHQSVRGCAGSGASWSRFTKSFILFVIFFCRCLQALRGIEHAAQIALEDLPLLH